MAYDEINPFENLRRFLETRPLSSYSREVIRDIKLLSFSRDKLANVFGSYLFRIQKYPGDIDLVEEFTECCNEDQVIEKFEISLKNIIKNIRRAGYHYFSEFKAGLDYRYDIDIGELKLGEYIPNPVLANISENMLKTGLLSMNEHEIIMYALNRPNLGADEHDAIFYIFRQRRVLRWTSVEIERGAKKLPLGKSITLNEALRHKTHIKIDIISEVDGRLVEITNFLQLAYITKDSDEIHYININLEENNNVPKQLPIEIEKLYFSNMFYSPFKAIKRMYSLGRHYLDRYLLNKILPFVSSNTSLLYQMRSQIDAILILYEKTVDVPHKLIAKEIDEMKMRFSVVIELPKEHIEIMNNEIDDINDTKSREGKIKKLKDFKKMLESHVNYETINYLKKIGFNPPPRQYLPSTLKYNIYKVRKPNEMPENPYEKYKHIIEMRNKREYNSDDELEQKRGGYLVYYPTENHYPNFLEPNESIARLSHRIKSNESIKEVPKTIEELRAIIEQKHPMLTIGIKENPLLTAEQKINEYVKRELERRNDQRIPAQIEGKGGNGNAYAHNYMLPLYANQNLPLPRFFENDNLGKTLTAGSFASDYVFRGDHFPLLKPPHIPNAPTIINGKIIKRAGCAYC